MSVDVHAPNPVDLDQSIEMLCQMVRICRFNGLTTERRLEDRIYMLPIPTSAKEAIAVGVAPICSRPNRP